jgi:hypothetical protein
MGPQALAFRPVPGHPFASFRTYTDALGRFVIEGNCSRCGPPGFWRKHCVRPHLWQDRVFRYAATHAHGLRPRAK